MSRRREPPKVRKAIQEQGIRCAMQAGCGQLADYYEKVGSGGIYWCRFHAPAELKRKKEAT